MTTSHSNHGEDETRASKAPEPGGSRFRTLKTLGSGGMGDVHLAEDSALRRQVAIKSIRTELCQDPEVRKRIERECLLHAKIGTHPHIVTLYDRMEEAGRIKLVMEYVEGETLYALLDRLAKQNKRLSLTEGIAIAVQTLEALARIHTHNIVHRDIKPANIMITRDDSGEYCAKLMDFGIARANDDDGMTALTQTGMGGPGTPLYMAPEQIDSKAFGAIAPATDVYAMGVMVYQIISGSPPFTGSITEIFNGHLNAKPLRLDAQADPHVPPAIADIIDRALAKRPENRYPSANAFREALLSVNTAAVTAMRTGPHTPPLGPPPPPAPGAAQTMAAHEMAEQSVLAQGQTMLHGAARPTKSRAGLMVAGVAAAMLVGAAAVTAAGGYWMYSKWSAGPTDTAAAEEAPAEPAAPALDAIADVAPMTHDPFPALEDLTPAALPPSDIPSYVSDGLATPAPGPVVRESDSSTASALDTFESLRQEKMTSDPTLTAAPPPPVTPKPAAATPKPAAATPKPAAKPAATTSTPAATPAPAPAAATPTPAAPTEEPKPASSGFTVERKTVQKTQP
jgi:eukaryotic-like serine/threonine-protein kinase